MNEFNYFASPSFTFLSRSLHVCLCLCVWFIIITLWLLEPLKSETNEKGRSDYDWWELRVALADDLTRGDVETVAALFSVYTRIRRRECRTARCIANRSIWAWTEITIDRIGARLTSSVYRRQQSLAGYPTSRGKQLTFLSPVLFPLPLFSTAEKLITIDHAVCLPWTQHWRERQHWPSPSSFPLVLWIFPSPRESRQ